VKRSMRRKVSFTGAFVVLREKARRGGPVTHVIAGSTRNP
jgi:hypothetical protein